MTILITGGAGFIGSNFVRFVLRHYPQYKVLVLDKLTYAGNENNLRDIQHLSNFQFERGDICDISLVDEIVSRSNVIVNFAAETHVDRSIHDPSTFVMTNVYGTNVLLEAARKHGTERVVHISTDEVYGSIESGSFTEEAPLKPTNPYSASKAAADVLALSYYKTYGVPILITRSSNVFGPYQYPEKLIPLFVTHAVEKKPLPLYGDGLNIRDWIYTEDVCAAIMHILHNGKDGEVYNVSAGNERTNLEIARSILDHLDQTEELITFVQDRPAHDKRYSVDGSKVEALGWSPGHSFLSALKETIQWYRENEWWWRKIKEDRSTYGEYFRRQYPTLVSEE
jgi:dTDP-glucose 4,6-dehydratase